MALINTLEKPINKQPRKGEMIMVEKHGYGKKNLKGLMHLKYMNLKYLLRTKKIESYIKLQVISMSKGFTLIEILISFVHLNNTFDILNVRFCTCISKIKQSKTLQHKRIKSRIYSYEKRLKASCKCYWQRFFGNFDKGTFIGNFAKKHLLQHS